MAAALQEDENEIVFEGILEKKGDLRHFVLQRVHVYLFIYFHLFIRGCLFLLLLLFVIVTFVI